MKLLRNNIIRKFYYAFAGLWHGLKHDHSIRTQFVFSLLACVMGFVFKFEAMEWMMVVFAIGLVIALEFVNSAIERLCDLVSLEKQAAIKHIKDYTAAAVLVASIGALVVALIIIGGKL